MREREWVCLWRGRGEKREKERERVRERATKRVEKPRGTKGIGRAEMYTCRGNQRDRQRNRVID